MIHIKKATTNDLDLLLELGKQTFEESHGHSCSKEDIEAYIKKVFSADALKLELTNPDNIFHIIYYNNKATGFSKITPSVNTPNSSTQNIAKLERIYILKEFYDKKLGLALMQFNIELSKKLNQKGMWLYAWIENHRAVNFYRKMGFKIIGKYDFKISETHSNPNHQMLLSY
ncbi:MAG: GNAT family N-acetyltransferase [Vicingaceae bacterium]|nr:GNAT family N-acetyltransferase [Vicingaceae bacterium]